MVIPQNAEAPESAAFENDIEDSANMQHGAEYLRNNVADSFQDSQPDNSADHTGLAYGAVRKHNVYQLQPEDTQQQPLASGMWLAKNFIIENRSAHNCMLPFPIAEGYRYRYRKVCKKIRQGML